MSQCDQHRREKLIVLCSIERKLPASTLADVALKSLVGTELDRAHIASCLLHTDKVVDVDIGALDVLAILVSALATFSLQSRKLCYLLALLDASANFYVEVSAQLLEHFEAVVRDVGRGEVRDDIFDCRLVFL